MRKIVASFIALSAALSMFSAAAQATESVSFDGVWWQSLSSDAGVYAVEGMLTGIDAGYYANHGVGHPRFSKKFGPYTASLDGFYLDHPGLLEVPAALVMLACLQDKPIYSTCDAAAKALK